MPLPVAEGDTTALTGEIGDFEIPELGGIGATNFDTSSNLPAATGGGEDPVERLRTLIGERQTETVEILRNWLESKEENV